MLVCGEPTYEGLFRLLQQGQPSAGIFSSEGGQLIGGYAMSDEHRLRTAAGLSEGWDGKPWKRVRGGDGLTVLPNRRLTLNLMVQPLVASRLLSDSVLRDQGVLSRVLVAAPRGTSGTRLSHEPDAASDTALDKYTLYVLEILRSGQAGRDDELPPLGFSGRARELWIAFADSIERQLGPEGKLAPVQPFANKAAEHAARIAGVLTVVANIKASDINHDTLTAAIDIVQFYLGEALRLHDIAQVDETLQRAQRLLDWLGRRWPERLLSLVDIYQRGPTEFRDRASAHAAVKILEEHGWLIHLDGVHEVAGTPRRDVWRIVAAG
jgi:hypothetical protein